MSTYPVTIENAAPKKRRGTGRLAITVNVNNIDAQAERNSLCEMQAYLVHLLLEILNYSQTRDSSAGNSSVRQLSDTYPVTALGINR